MTATDLSLAKHQADVLFQHKRLVGFAIPAVICVYLAYVFFAFDLPGLAQRANMDNAVTLASDSWSHKVHVTRDNRLARSPMPSKASARGTYPEGTAP
jgi:phosphonate transport system permease protein